MREEGRQHFLAKVREVHGDNLDTAEVVYLNSQTKVTLRCKAHDVTFSQKPNNTLVGKTGCKLCESEKRKNSSPFRYTTAEYLEKCRAVHGDRYDYSKTEYSSAHTPVTITCAIHGDFYQIARLHHKGCGCPTCGDMSSKSKQRDSQDEFAAAGKAVHGERYDYSQGDYKGNLMPYKIICETHGEFWQTPKDHKQGRGCQKCGYAGPSKPELEIAEFVRTLGFEVSNGDRQLIAPMELDIVVEAANLAVEYHGLYYHSEKFIDRNYHLDKLKLCEAKGIDLIQVFEDEWDDPSKREIVKSIIASRLGSAPRKIFARKTKTVKVTAKEARDFLNANHIQGFAASAAYYGLRLPDGELVSLMLLTPPRKGITVSKVEYDLELVRFASLKNTSVVGGFSKLLKEAGGKKVVTYCDRRLFNAKGYEAVGFKKVRFNPPEYYYTKSRSGRLSRLGYQKKYLADKLEAFDPEKTEHQNMLDNGYYRVYGCGTVTLTLNSQPK
jgi:protein-arginine kinase activator protein McsA